MNYELVEKVLTDARQVVGTPDKWCQGQYSNYRGAYCTVGAFNLACNGMFNRQAEFHTLSALWESARDVFCEVNDITTSVAYWNDRPERTHNEILAAFDRAIAYCQVRREPAPQQSKSVLKRLAVQQAVPQTLQTQE